MGEGGGEVEQRGPKCLVIYLEVGQGAGLGNK